MAEDKEKIDLTETENKQASANEEPEVLNEKETKKAKERILAGTNKPIEYFYIVGENKTNGVEYIEVQQYINDKFAGRIIQQQYFPIAEQSNRILELNKYMLEQVMEDYVKFERVKFLVQVTPKWFSSPLLKEQFLNYVYTFKDKVILCFDAGSLIKAGKDALDTIRKIVKDYHTKILIDNVEFQNLVQIIGYHADYVRFDARLIDKSDENYTQVIKFMRDYLKAQGSKMVVRNIKDEAQRYYFLNNGADVVEGNGVYTPKKLISSITKDYDIK